MRRKISKHFSGNTERLVNKIFFVVIPVLLGLSLVFGVYNSSRANQTAEQLRKQNEQLVAISDQQKKSLETTRTDVADLKETLLCMATFFSMTDRQNVIISSYNPCIVENTDTGEKTQLNLLQSGSGSNRPSASGGSSQNGSGQDNSVPSSSSNNTPPQKPVQSDSSQNPPVVNPENPPVSLLERILNGTIETVRGLL